MMQYSRQGLYIQREKKARKSNISSEKSVDWINIFLFILLVVVVILFVVT